MASNMGTSISPLYAKKRKGQKMTADPKIAVAIGAEDRELVTALAGVSEAIKQFAEQAQQQFKSVKKSLDFTTVATALRPTLDMLTSLKSKIVETADAAMVWNKEVNGMARTLGISTTAAGGLTKALGKLRMDTDTYRGAVFALQRSLNSQEKDLNANGVVTRDASGEMLNMQQVMMNTINRLRQMKPGYDANALSMLAFGRQAKELGQLMKLTSEGIEEGTAKVKALGIEVDAQSTGAVKAYQDAINDVKDTLESLKIKIGQELMPQLAALSKKFADIATSVAPALSAVIKGLSVVTEHWGKALAVLFMLVRDKLWTAVVGLTTELKKQTGATTALSAVTSTLTTKLKALAASLLGPNGVILLIMGAVTAYQHFSHAATRAADAQVKLTDAVLKANSNYLSYTQMLRDNEAALKNAKPGSDEHNRLLKIKGDLLSRLEVLQPGFRALLRDEAGGERDLADAIKLANDARKKELEGKVEAEGKLVANAWSELEAAKLQSKSMVGGWFSHVKDKQEALDKLSESYEALKREVLALDMASAANTGAAFVPPTKDKPEKPESHVSIWEIEFKRQEDANAKKAEAEGRYHETTLMAEREFWSEKLAIIGLSEKERETIELRIIDIDAHIRAERKKSAENEAADELKIRQGQQATLTMMRLASLEDERGDIESRFNMGKINIEQRIELERSLIEREQTIRRAALQEKMEEDTLTVVQQAELYEQLKQLDIEFQNRLAENTRRRTEQQAEMWKSLGDSMRQSMASAMVDLINGTKSWHEATKALMNEVLQSFIQMIAKQLTQHVTMENAKLLWTKLTKKQEVTAVETAATEESAAEVSAAGVVATANAVKAGSGAAASQASIPYVGPVLAVAAMASILAAVMALKGNLNSAAGGYWDVPHDQLAQIHKNEMVLPAQHSARLRELLEGGEDGGLGGGGSTTNITINAVDAASVNRLFRNNGAALVNALKSQSRNYAFQQG